MTTVVQVERDECDACPWEAHVQAFLYATHGAWASSLAFCGHHGTEYLPKLTELEAVISDQRRSIPGAE